MIEIRQLDNDTMSDIAAIDVSETGTERYKVRDGQLQLVEEAWQRPRWNAKQWTQTIERWATKLEPDLYLGAYIDGKIVGLATLRYHLTPVMAQLTSLHVDRAHRRQGVAGRLMQEVFHLVKRPDVTAIYVSATPSSGAVRFYLRQGFQPTATPDPHQFALEPFDIHMVKELP